MITGEQADARLRECGYLGGENRAAVLAAMFRGDVVIMVEQNLKPTYVGAYRREVCRPLAEAFPGIVYE